LFVSPVGLGTPQSVTVRATSVADPSKSSTANITINPLPSVAVSVTPQTSTITAGQQMQLSASVSGTSNQQVTWTVLTPGGGNISATGLYSSPAFVAVQQNIVVQATSVADPSKSASALMVVNPAPSTPAALCPAATYNVVTGCYYRDLNFGTLVTSRADAGFQLNSLLGQVPAGVGPDNFSVRWQGNFVFQGSWYVFYLTADDGARLYVDGNLVFDSATPGTPAGPYYRAWFPASGGVHSVRLDYVHHTGNALAQLSWGNAQ